MSDLEGRFARGDEAAFNETVERYSRKVYGLCYRVLRDEEEAKDLVQEVFVRAYLKRRSFKGRSSLYTWLYRIAMNMCFSHIKKRKAKTVPLEQVEGVLEAKPEHETGTTIELQNLLSRAVGSLPPKQRAVFAMRFYDKMTYKEIAAAMGTSVGAAKANHHFAVERLREILNEADPK